MPDGHYITAETITVKGNKARIISPVVKMSAFSQHCLQYAYYMNGEDVGQLNLYVKVGLGVPNSPAYILSGSQGPFWVIDKITFNINSQIDFQVLIRLF